MSDRVHPGGEPGATRRLARWATGLTVDAVPTEVRAHTCRLVLDGLGSGLFGTTTPWGRIVGDLVLDAGGAAESTVWGSDVRVPAAQAALANGTFVHSFEFDDLHAAAVIHGAAQVVPAALAVAEQRLLRQEPGVPTGADLLLACVAGFEVGARVGLATGSEQLSRGFHPSPNTGLFGAAVTAGLLLGLDEDGLADALGVAGSSGGFLMAAQYGAMVKRMHPGRSAQAGVLGAQLAARGFTGIADVLEEPYGGFARAYAGVGADALDEVVDGLGTEWETLRYSVKAYPCCGSNHTSVDAYQAILEKAPDLKADDIDHIVVSCSTLTANHVGWPYVPSGVTSAQMNLAYTLAVFATDRELFVDQFAADRVQDPRVVDLAGRVHVHADPDIDRQGRDARHLVRVVVSTRDGRRLEREVRHALGSAHRPISHADATHKFRRLAGVVLGHGDVRAVEHAVTELASASDDPGAVSRLLTGLRHATPRPVSTDGPGRDATRKES